MAKKKKPSLKPVARGFATTSVPKKVIPVDEDPPVLEGDSLEITSSAQNAEADHGPGEQRENSDSENDRNVLQSIVEKLQDKTEKEIVRTIKTIEYDRRFSKNLARVDIDRAIRDQILDLISGSEHPGDVAQQRPDEAEDKLIARIGITYGVLMRLGFSEERVIDCLNLIPGVDLDEAFDWLYLHCSELELENDERTPELPLTPRTPRTPESSSMPATPVPSKKLLPLDTRHSATPVTFLSADAASFDSDTKVQVLAKDSHLKTDSGSETDGSVEDPNLEYVALKMKISDLIAAGQSRGGNRADELIVGLEARLAEVKKHYFFDEKDAETEFRLKRREADKADLQAQLRGLPIPPKLPTRLERHDRQLRDDPPEQVGRNIDVFDIDDSGGLLDILEPMPTSETTASGTIVNVVDLGSPKLWTGRTPKVVLQEFISKTDRYATVSYQDISGHSRAKRASVSVRWGSGKNGNWEMLDAACHSITQAEQYVATVALHSLIRPPTLGFASGGANSGNSPTSFRLLPAVFRDVWNDLEARRKDREDQTNRRVWGMLKEIVSKKVANDSKHNAKPAKATVASDSLPTFKVLQPHDWTAEQLRTGFLARQASPAYQHMLAQRNTLPIAHYRKDIIESLEMSQILVLSGETGCGKSTQLPSFILEDQLSRGRSCKILVTEPRRISAISLAQRVSRELGDPPGAVGTLSSLVGYSIRLESHTTRNTRLTFVTNGIALRMLEGGTGHGGQGTAFDEITHIVIDEVHERSIESDFLLIVLKSLLAQRRDLKVVLMSATVDAEKISDFFGGCPTLQVPGRTFPVDVRYLEDAIEFTQWTINESSPFARRKNDKFYRNGKHRQEWSEDLTIGGEDDDDDVTQAPVKLEQRYSPATLSTVNMLDERLIPYDLIIGLLEKVCFSDHAYIHFSAAVLVFMPGLGEIRRLNDMLLDHPLFSETAAFRIYPLHSMISNENQSAAFDVPPVGVRKVVIATNIAETGITIPDITCVIDSGKHREMRFDEKRQISRLIETYIARSNAAQRRGRAGRVQPGLCFHLFTKVRHDTQMAEHALPEMMRLSLSDLSLRIKIMKVKLGSSIEDVLSRAMDPPSSINIQRAVSALVEVQALTANEEITPMGRLLSKLPTDVHLGKFLLIAVLFRCLDPALTIAAALNSKSPFVSPFGLEEEADRAKQSFKVDNSDFLTIHNAFASWRRASENPGFVRKFCRQNYLSHQNLQQIEELRQQFLGYLIDSSFIRVDDAFVKELSRSRYSKGRTRFITVPPEYDRNFGENTFLLNAALCAGLYPKLLTIDAQGGQQMRTLSNSQPAAFHPSSVNFGKKSTTFGVNHLCYFTIMQSKRLYAWETAPVDDVAILLLCGDADFKLNSDSVFIDRKIKYRLEPKTNVAIKHLRNRLATNLALEFKGKALTPAQIEWNDLALKLLGKAKLDDRPAQTIVVH